MCWIFAPLSCGFVYTALVSEEAERHRTYRKKSRSEPLKRFAGRRYTHKSRYLRPFIVRSYCSVRLNFYKIPQEARTRRHNEDDINHIIHLPFLINKYGYTKCIPNGRRKLLLLFTIQRNH